MLFISSKKEFSSDTCSLLNNIPFYEYITFLSIHRHLDFFYTLAVMNNLSMKIHAGFCVFSFILGIYLGESYVETPNLNVLRNW